MVELAVSGLDTAEPQISALRRNSDVSDLDDLLPAQVEVSADFVQPRPRSPNAQAAHRDRAPPWR